MKKIYKVKIKKKGNKLQYPKELGKKYDCLAFNTDYTEAVIEADLTAAKHTILTGVTGVTLLSKVKAAAVIKEYQPVTVTEAKVNRGQRRKEKKAARKHGGGFPDMGSGPGGMFGSDALSYTAEGELEEETIDLPQEEWIEPEKMLNGWINFGGAYNPAGFFMDSNGMVHLRGLVKGGKFSIQNGAGVGDKKGTVFVLPEGYTPSNRQLHMVGTGPPVSPIAAARVEIANNGSVVAVTGSDGWLSLDGILFRAAD